MNLSDAVEFLGLIGAAFGGSKPKESGAEIWAVALADVPADDAKKALAKFALESQFPPTIRDIRRMIPEHGDNRRYASTTKEDDWRYRKKLDEQGLCLAEGKDRYGRTIASCVSKGYMCRQAGTYTFRGESLPRWVLCS